MQLLEVELSELGLIEFIDLAIQKNELGRPFALMDHQREVLQLAFAFDEDGQLPWDTVIYSCPKKSGKTTINAAVTLWWALTQEAPNEILIVANDLEQSLARVFKTMLGIIRHNPEIKSEATPWAKTIDLENATGITAISGDYAGAAGSNHGLVSYDELWAYTSESSRRLWEELTPVPTRTNSIRFISSYAGWESESELLHDLYKQVVSKEEHPDGQGERIHPDLPVYANREARIFAYWDHEPRMPWQTERYYNAQRKHLRAGTYLRLHENKWATAESVFITPELWDPSIDASLSPLLPTREYPLFVGVDAATKHDNAAVVAVRWDGNKLALVSHRIWKPTPENPLDLEATIEAHLETLHERYRVAEILCDPFQLHRSITTLKSKGLRIREFPQSVPNVTLMGQSLFDLLNGKNLRTYPAEDLRDQALATVAVESPRGWRIAKEKASKKIDAIVALSMACVAALDRGRPKTLEDYAQAITPGKTDGPVRRHGDQELFSRQIEGTVTVDDILLEKVVRIAENVQAGGRVDWGDLSLEEREAVVLVLKAAAHETKIKGMHKNVFSDELDRGRAGEWI